MSLGALQVPSCSSRAERRRVGRGGDRSRSCSRRGRRGDLSVCGGRRGRGPADVVRAPGRQSPAWPPRMATPDPATGRRPVAIPWLGPWLSPWQ